jgi:hypothetical protein
LYFCTSKASTLVPVKHLAHAIRQQVVAGVQEVPDGLELEMTHAVVLHGAVSHKDGL